MPDLVETAVTTNPPAPVRAPGTTFSVTDTVQNAGLVRIRVLEDALLPLARWGEERRRHPVDRGPRGPGSGCRGQPYRDRHGDHPRGHPAQYYFLLACADDQNAVAETDEANNCIASAGATVTVTRI